MTDFLNGLKAFVAALRDGLLTLLLILFLAAPAWINARMIAAGFTEADVAGFKWKKAVEQNNVALATANATIGDLNGQLQKTQTALDAARAQVPAAAPAEDEVAVRLRIQNRALVTRSADTFAAVRGRIAANHAILAQPAASPGP